MVPRGFEASKDIMWLNQCHKHPTHLGMAYRTYMDIWIGEIPDGLWHCFNHMPVGSTKQPLLSHIQLLTEPWLDIPSHEYGPCSGFCGPEIHQVKLGKDITANHLVESLLHYLVEYLHSLITYLVNLPIDN